MRIDIKGFLLNQVPSDDKTQKVSAKNGIVRNSKPDETGSLSLDKVSILSLEETALASPEVRQERVDALREAIRNSDYSIEPQKIAQAMIEQLKR